MGEALAGLQQLLHHSPGALQDLWQSFLGQSGNHGVEGANETLPHFTVADPDAPPPQDGATHFTVDSLKTLGQVDLLTMLFFVSLSWALRVAFFFFLPSFFPFLKFRSQICLCAWGKRRCFFGKKEILQPSDL